MVSSLPTEQHLPLLLRLWNSLMGFPILTLHRTFMPKALLVGKATAAAAEPTSSSSIFQAIADALSFHCLDNDGRIFPWVVCLAATLFAMMVQTLIVSRAIQRLRSEMQVHPQEEVITIKETPHQQKEVSFQTPALDETNSCISDLEDLNNDDSFGSSESVVLRTLDSGTATPSGRVHLVSSFHSEEFSATDPRKEI